MSNVSLRFAATGLFLAFGASVNSLVSETATRELLTVIVGALYIVSVVRRKDGVR